MSSPIALASQRLTDSLRHLETTLLSNMVHIESSLEKKLNEEKEYKKEIQHLRETVTRLQEMNRLLSEQLINLNEEQGYIKSISKNMAIELDASMSELRSFIDDKRKIVASSLLCETE